MALINCPDCASEVSDAAPACPRCGRPIAASITAPAVDAQRAEKIAAANRATTLRGKIALAAIVVIGGLAWLGSNSPKIDATGSDNQAPPDAQQSAPTPEVAIETTPDQLKTAYDTNEVAADNIFKGKIIRIVGTVSSIDKDFTDDVVVQLATSDQFTHVGATMDDSEKGAAAALRKGQKVSVECQRIMRVLDTPVASKCRFS